MSLEQGLPYPLGATVCAEGVNFAVASEHARAIELCLFDAGGTRELQRLPLPASTDGIWHGFLRGARAGLVYGFRVHGEYAPEHGHRFNPHKLLLDPYAREIVGRFEWNDAHFGYVRDDPMSHRSLDSRDNAGIALKARVAAPLAGARRRSSPLIPDTETVLYEVHVKGFTKLHPDIPPALRGTYSGLAHPAALTHLRTLGITTVSLQPVHYALNEERLTQLGLVNYWGYNTIGYFCVEPRYSSTPDDPTATRAEFRAMVDALHAAGIEVLIDVVFNHTAEGAELGPTLSFRGLDNAMWYRLRQDDRALSFDVTGCGNTLNVHHPRVTQFVLDGLRYWVEEMGVDGFRFDLATVLGRTWHNFESHAAFFVALAQDPTLAQAKLVAEPWDVGHGGYQLGSFPPRFLEWNDRFRDGLRQFWLTRSVDRAEFARRLLASSDRFSPRRREPTASVNFVTAHDGFTLRDLVSYAAKHNQANGEGDRDGHNHNHGINCGVEGDTDDAAVNAQRLRLQRALLATVLLAQGTPMLLAGDELNRTQQGNNNAYCQDNEITWIDWETSNGALTAFVARVIALRQSGALLARDRWYSGKPRADGIHDARWLSPNGREMTVADWHDPLRHCVGIHISAPRRADALLIFNAEIESVYFVLPPGYWRKLLDSSVDDEPAESRAFETLCPVPPQTVVALLHEVPASFQADEHD